MFNQIAFSRDASRPIAALVFLTITIIFFSGSGVTAAELPKIISFQGELTDNSGRVVNGSTNIEFKIYNAPTNGTLLWTENHNGGNAVVITDGVYNVELGSITPLVLPFDTGYWISVNVEADGEMSPRYKLVTSPYAYYSATADTAFILADGAITYGELTIADTLSVGTTATISDTLIVQDGLIVDGTTLFVDPNSNRVGIGTTTPASTLQVSDTVTASYFDGATNNSYFYFLQMGDSSDLRANEFMYGQNANEWSLGDSYPNNGWSIWYSALDDNWLTVNLTGVYEVTCMGAIWSDRNNDVDVAVRVKVWDGSWNQKTDMRIQHYADGFIHHIYPFATKWVGTINAGERVTVFFHNLYGNSILLCPYSSLMVKRLY